MSVGTTKREIQPPDFGVSLLSLEVLTIMNRPGNWASQQRSVGSIERAIGLCRRGGFRRVRIRGDSKFSLTEHFDRWDGDRVLFQFGYDAKKNLVPITDRCQQENLIEQLKNWTRGLFSHKPLR
jgi:hypothetical protein